ncbi:MAG TPA: amidase, partial [Variovorax sp.]|nr:amidase [Variovorax sp.]
PSVNAIVTLDAQGALAAADAMDAALARGASVGALCGLPVAVKDTTPTANMRTTMGSPIFRDHVPTQDALVVERLRKAGAIVIGKTNVPEFAAGSQTFNAIFGVTRNPYDLDMTCGGSSGGAAVAVATGMSAIADGSDMGGSLRNPASFCNVVGLRPTPGRVPQWPGKNPWGNLAVAGPMGRSVADVALALSVMAGPDPRCPTALETPGAHFAAPLQRDFRGLRIAFAPDFGGQMPVDPQVSDVLEEKRHVFRDLGFELSDDLPDFRGAQQIFLDQRSIGFEAALGPLMDRHRALMKEDLIWNIEHGRSLTGAQVAHAERERSTLFEQVRQFMEHTPFLALPVSQVSPFPVDQPFVSEINGQRMGNYLEWMQSSCCITVTGHPAISVPCGFTASGVPVGIQLVGRYGDDWSVLQLAHAFEQATHTARRRPPRPAGPG